MAETAVQQGQQTSEIATETLTLLLDGAHVIYKVYEDRRPRLREVMSSGFKKPSYREIHAVRGISLEVRQGESIGVVGRNGSGKSTMLQAMAGLLPVDRGEVYARSQPTLLGVSAAMNKSVSGRRNILLGGLALGMSRAAVEQQMDEVIRFAGLEEFIDLPVRTYSSGMRARLHFAIATSVRPEILLIDEALSVGDEVFKKRSQARIQDLLDSAGTVVVVSHSLDTVKELSTRVIWLEKGELVADGEPDEVVDAYKEKMSAESDA